jgi:putative ABC transport system substrate-binding protein
MRVAAFAAMQAEGVQALVIGSDPRLQRDGAQLADMALKAHLPTVCQWPEMAEEGCLIAYGPNRTTLRKRIAHQIAQIFRGASPGDIPIERPTAFEFRLKIRVAKALDINFPAAVITRADEVIEPEMPACANRQLEAR